MRLPEVPRRRTTLLLSLIVLAPIAAATFSDFLLAAVLRVVLPSGAPTPAQIGLPLAAGVVPAIAAVVAAGLALPARHWARVASAAAAAVWALLAFPVFLALVAGALYGYFGFAVIPGP